jgi:hypothetical protein
MRGRNLGGDYWDIDWRGKSLRRAPAEASGRLSLASMVVASRHAHQRDADLMKMISR